MAERVKQRRRYESPRRREQAAATRREILEAAQRLFERQGYAATTMAAIAKEARVALKTVYVAYETKSGLLRALWHLLLRGDEGETPVGERDWYLAVLEEPDPEEQLRLNARNSRQAKERIGEVLEVIRTAAATDPDIGVLWERIQSNYLDNQRAIVETIGKKKALKPGLDVDSATDILWSLNHPSLWQALVGYRGWTPDRYEEWCADAAAEQLLDGKRRRSPRK
jgi:AcrR family transcriptional regulator